MRWPPCGKHSGKHLDVHGQCVHPGAPCALKPARCADCGVATMRRLDLQTGEVTTVEAGSDALHAHAAPLRVELDEDALASAIVRASRATREERVRQDPQLVNSGLTSAPEAPSPSPDERPIPTVMVWTDDGALS